MLNSSERQKLRGLAHHLDTSIIIGKHGYNEGARQSISESLEKNELIKIKFNEHKSNKKDISIKMETDLDANVVSIIGNIVIIFKQNPDPTKQKVII